MNRKVIPLWQRPGDIVLLLFFCFDVFFIAPIVDLEQLVIADASNFTYPVWPLPFLVDMVHNYGNTYDPLQIARPAWWRAFVWHHEIFGVPFYLAAIYAFWKGKEWIRVPAFLYGAALFTIVATAVFEERYGQYAAPNFTAVFLFNLPWLLAPAYWIYRMWRFPHPFTKEVSPAS